METKQKIWKVFTFVISFETRSTVSVGIIQ